MKVIWPLAAAASLYGAIAGSFFDDAPLMGIALPCSELSSPWLRTGK